MFDDLSLAQLEALRSEVRAAYQKLVTGAAVSQVRYGELGQVFHPTTPQACEQFLKRVTDEIARRNGGCLRGPVIIAGT